MGRIATEAQKKEETSPESSTKSEDFIPNIFFVHLWQPTIYAYACAQSRCFDYPLAY